MKEIPLKNLTMMIRAMPADQAIQQIKSQLSGLPVTQVIKGELMIYLKSEQS